MSNAGRFTNNSPAVPSRYLISGVTRDAGTANAIGNVNVDVFETATNLYRGSTVSDASGNYAVEITGDRGLTFFIKAYKATAPDVSGTTVNTVVAS